VADRLPKATQGADRARAFERIPWPHGPEDEPLARTDLNLLRPTIADATRQMTRREQMRERVALKKSDRSCGLSQVVAQRTTILAFQKL
jgi:hypothetical protein